MTSLEELASRQEATGQEIIRICKNYKKDGSSRKTADYLKGKLRSLQPLWNDFETTDNFIRVNYPEYISHSYFTKDYYNAVGSVIEDVQQDIHARLNSLDLSQLPGETATQPSPATTATQGEATNLPSAIINTQGTQDKTTGAMSLPRGPTKEFTTANTDGEKSLMGTIPKRCYRPSKVEDSDQHGHGTDINGTIRRQRSLINSLERLLNGLPAPLREQSESFLQIKIKAIEQYWSQIQHLHHVVWESTEQPDTFGYEEDTYFNLEEQVHYNLIQLHEASRYKGSSIPRSINPPIETSSIVPSMKLPKIILSKFDGDYLKWRQFRDLFTELVHNQPIADCQKIWYLKTSLCGEAERLVRHLTTSDANYATAWRIINERYENIRLLVTALLNKLLGQCQINHESAHAIRTMHDTTHECLLALSALGIATDQWDPLLLHILIRKIDKNTHTLWEQSLKDPRALQSLKEFLRFLENRFQSLEALGAKGKTSEEAIRRPQARSLTTTVTADVKCPTCKGNHQVFNCSTFLQASPSKRYSLIKASKACINCLRSGHTVNQCPSSKRCRDCNKPHNTLLHIQTKPEIAGPNPSKLDSTQKVATNSQQLVKPLADPISLTAKAHHTTNKQVLLSTVRVNLIASSGNVVEARAILDNGSQPNIITEKMAGILGFTGTPASMTIEGINRQRQPSRRHINLTIKSKINNFSCRLLVHILPEITSPQPAQEIDISAWPLPRNIQLADPRFNCSDSIDLLIGAELFYSLLCVGQITLGDNLPVLQNTVFGWVVGGGSQQGTESSAVCGICSEDEALDTQIEKFWRLETPIEQTNLTAAERRCEAFFDRTTTRDEDGRFIVRLPFQGEPTSLGESKDIALQRFMSVERRLARHDDLREQYVNFMNEYMQLGHMKEINFNEIEKPYFFLPHHCVSKPDSTTTKLRVVFDGSAKTSTNISLNDLLSTGPTVQDDVFSHLLRFRMPRYVFTSDIEKMYRQIRVNEEDQRYQLIWWRSDPEQRIKCFQLTTVTYGTTSAPYLATKSLQRLADETKEQYPLGAEVLKRDFYVDDVLTGSDNISTAVEIQAQIQTILKSAGMTLRKWCANSPRLLQNIDPRDQELALDFDSKDEDSIKTIGLTWLPKSDQFSIRTSTKKHDRITKRTAYSDIARCFDPLGIMAPVIVLAKLFLQRLWSIKLDWDAALPQEMYTYWINFRDGLAALNNIKFERHIFNHRAPKSYQFHIFADASEKAYGAAVYVKSVDKTNIITVRLLCAKSRVAPTKQITLPRLELCAAKLAAELAARISKDLNIKHNSVYLWTDSEIVLHWINSQSSSFHTFVANRVSSIQQLTSSDQWRHVTSNQNPADVLSRGIIPEKFTSCNLWFYGPIFLHGSEMSWPPPYIKKRVEDDSERRKVAFAATTTQSSNIITTIDHQNSFKRLQRVVGYILRFISNSKGKATTTHTWLSKHELDAALVLIIRCMQQEEFKEDISFLERFGEVAKTSAISTLTPFLDRKGIIRVGGRLEQSSLPYNAKHPMLLPYSHPLTKLLINEMHKENLHVGAQTLLSIVRQTYWPIKGKILTRSVVQHCVQCARAKPKLSNQLMGNLPRDRVEPARPFANTGIDFCGPVWVHFKIRGKRPLKAYIAVFCCFATKASHLEVVTDLSTQGFIWALKRFIGRRGHCKTIYCDNGSNFIGARNQLEEIKKMLESKATQENIASSCTSRGIEFKFIPPRAPHFGGLWEATVKSAKHLLQKTLLSASLTHEELETAVVEAEAILNSRPLTPMSSNPNDLTAITPAHFLIGEPLTTPIDADVEPLRGNLLSRWKLIAHIKGEFWRRWSLEYLNHLQQRYKWKNKVQNIQPGTMVILKEDNTPPLKWPLGRIINSIKGADGLARVVDVRTASGILRRAVHKIAPLPIEELHTNDASEEVNQIAENLDSLAGASSNPTTTVHKPVSNDATTGSNSLRNTPRKRQRLSLGAAVVTLLLTSVFLPSATSSPIDVSPFTSRPGIFFENLGIANTMTSKWNLVLYYDMGPYWKEYAYITNCTQNLDKLCSMMADQGPCLRILDNIKALLNEMVDNNEILLPTQQGQRVKRGAINIIGNVANSLFGILDSEYAEHMAQTIENIQGNEDHLLHLIKNQTTIIDATMNLMKHDSETIEKHFGQLENHLNELSKQVNKVHEENRDSKIHQLFIMLSMQLFLALSKYQKAQGDIMNVLTDTQHGKINPQLISPRQLREEVIKIKSMLPSSLKMPQFQDDMLKLYNLMTIEGRPTINYIIFQFKLPLLALEDFELYKLTPVPVPVNNTFIAVKPSANFFIINLHRDQYYLMDDLSTCVSVVHDNYICEQRKPMFHKGSNVGACEISYFNQAPHPSMCEIMNLGPGPHWIQLHTPNQWIYSVLQPSAINVVCGTNVTQYTLMGAGRITIQSKCVIKQQFLTIQSHNIYPSSFRRSYLPSGNLTDMITPEDLSPTVLINSKNISKHVSSQIRELENLRRDLFNLQTQLPNKIQPHDYHQFAVGYTGLIFTALIFGFIIWKYRLICMTRKKDAAIRTTQESEDPEVPEEVVSRSSFSVPQV